MAANAPIIIQKGHGLTAIPIKVCYRAGQVAGLINDLPSAGDIIDTIMADAQERLQNTNIKSKSGN